MSALTCIIDFQGRGPASCNKYGQEVLLSHENILFMAEKGYKGKFLWSRSGSRFTLLIGTAFLVKDGIHGLVQDISQIEKLEFFPGSPHKPEELLTGFYNILVADTVKKEVVIHNCHFGMRPLFYAETQGSLVVSTHPESIVKTGLVEGKLRLSTAVQFFLFNYALNEDTVFRNVYSLPAGSRLRFNGGNPAVETWFDPASLITKPIFSFRDSSALIMESLNNVIKKYSGDIKSFSSSLTGGWDGRVILALLRDKGLDINTYSHGTLSHPDVIIPMRISRELGIPYTPYILDDDYYANRFPGFARKTVDKSAAMRSFTRAHYIYSISSEFNRNDYIFTGICGSNLMKGGNITPGPVTNFKVLQMIYETDFDKYWKFLEEHYLRYIAPRISVPEDEMEYLRNALSEVHAKFHNSASLEMRLYRFMLNTVERKYFGSEIMTYSDLGENLSPFIDIDFIRALSTTPYFGAYMQVKSGNIFANWRNSLLYAHIINSAYPGLGKIPSDKGVSLYDIATFYRWPWVIRQQVRRKLKKNRVQYYNHAAGMENIISSAKDFSLLKPGIDFNDLRGDKELVTNLISFAFWASAREKYL